MEDCCITFDVGHGDLVGNAVISACFSVATEVCMTKDFSAPMNLCAVCDDSALKHRCVSSDISCLVNSRRLSYPTAAIYMSMGWDWAVTQVMSGLGRGFDSQLLI